MQTGPRSRHSSGMDTRCTRSASRRRPRPPSLSPPALGSLGVEGQSSMVQIMLGWLACVMCSLARYNKTVKHLCSERGPGLHAVGGWAAHAQTPQHPHRNRASQRKTDRCTLGTQWSAQVDSEFQSQNRKWSLREMPTMPFFLFLAYSGENPFATVKLRPTVTNDRSAPIIR